MKRLGHDIVTHLDPACRELTGKSLVDVLQVTPEAGVSKKKSASERKKENRDKLRDVKTAIQTEIRMKDNDLLFQNRLSFRKYNSIRMAESFETPKQAVVRSKSVTTPTSRTHGRSPESLPCDKDALLDEARTWSDDQTVNWTQLAKRYGVEGDNAGQSVKEYLASQSISAAMKKRQIIRRAKLRLPGGEITYPTHLTVAAQKNQLLAKIESGEIMIGELITPIIFTKYIADKTTKRITETTVTLHGRRISLTDIRTKLLKDQEQLGVVRLSNPFDDENLSEDEVDNAIIVRKISLDATHTTITKLEQLQKAKQVRYLKVWHDHGPIAGIGHFMVLVSAIYIPPTYTCVLYQCTISASV